MGGEDDELKGLLGLPEEETELDVIPRLCHYFVFWDSSFSIMQLSVQLEMPKTQQEVFLSPVMGLCHFVSYEVVNCDTLWRATLCDLVMYDQG